MLSVSEVSELLGIGERAVQKRLALGGLKGTRKKNQNGVSEWQVSSNRNKEIREALERAGRLDILETPDEEAGSDVVDATIAVEESEASVSDSAEGEPTGSGAASAKQVSDALNQIAEAMVKPLQEQLKQRDIEIQAANYRLGYLEGILKEKEEQIKLLPDYQAKAQERDQLNAALETQKQEVETAQQKFEKDLADQAAKLAEEERKAKALADENEALKLKAEEAALNATMLKQLQEEMLKLKNPWWKKWFNGSGS